MKILKGILVFIYLILVVILLSMIILTSNTKDFCLDSGYCKEGLELNTENKKIVVNEKTCIENRGYWISNKKVCQFKNGQD